MDWFRGPLAALEEAERYLKNALHDYRREQEIKRQREEAEARAAAEAERKRLLAEAEQAEDHHEADALIEEAALVPDPHIAPETPKVQGIHTMTTWGAEVTDKMALIKAVAAGKVPEAALDVNMKLLNQQAKSLREQLSWPGVRAVATETVVARGR